MLQCCWLIQAGVLCYISPVLSSECLASSISPFLYIFYIFLYIFISPMPSPHPCHDFVVLQPRLSVQPSARQEQNTISVIPARCLALEQHKCGFSSGSFADSQPQPPPKCWIWSLPLLPRSLCRAQLLYYNPRARSEELPETSRDVPGGQVGSSSQLSDG